MKSIHSFLAVAAVFAWLSGSIGASADTIVMANGNTMAGTAIQTNGDEILILTKYAAFNFSKRSVKEIRPGSPDASEPSGAGRIPDFQRAILFLSSQPWVTNLTPIPATVIDKGILRHVPYTSFRCAGDYEVNIYGDLDNPAGFEIGMYRKLLSDDSAKGNCIKFITDLLNQPEDKEIVQGARPQARPESARWPDVRDHPAHRRGRVQRLVDFGVFRKATKSRPCVRQRYGPHQRVPSGRGEGRPGKHELRLMDLR